MLKWLIVGLLVFLFYRLSMRRPRYTRLFSGDHLMELSKGLGAAKEAAHAHAGKKNVRENTEHNASDPFATGQGFMTSAEIAVVYTIAKGDEGGAEHHISMSHRGGPFALAAGGFLAAAIRRLLGLEEHTFVLARSNRGVYHMIFEISADEAEDYAERSVPVLDAEGARALLGLAMDERNELIDKLGKLEVRLD